VYRRFVPSVPAARNRKGVHVTTTEYKKPLPRPTVVSAPFWAAAKEQRLVVQQCRRCANLQHYPRPFCLRCAGDDLAWKECSGRATVYAFTVVRQAANQAFAEDVPYVHAVVELAEGPHMATNIVGCPPEQVRVGMPVTATFDDVTPEITLIRFKPV
jgi:uncharacterized OB-fold protein